MLPLERAKYRDLLELCDVAIYTFYPFVNLGAAAFNDTESVADAAGRFPALYEDYSEGLPVVLQEIGATTDSRFYPELNVEGALQYQANFVRAVFEEWGTAGVRVPFLNWYTMFAFHVADPETTPKVDTPEMPGGCSLQCGSTYPRCGIGDAIADALKIEGSPNRQNANRYFGGAGLIRSTGEAKPAWNTIVELAALLRVQGG